MYIWFNYRAAPAQTGRHADVQTKPCIHGPIMNFTSAEPLHTQGHRKGMQVNHEHNKDKIFPWLTALGKQKGCGIKDLYRKVRVVIQT